VTPASPVKLMWTGFACLAVGWTVLFLMVIRVIRPGFAAAFGAYGLTVVGLVLGLTGAFSCWRRRE